MNNIIRIIPNINILPYSCRTKAPLLPFHGSQKEKGWKGSTNPSLAITGALFTLASVYASQNRNKADKPPREFSLLIKKIQSNTELQDFKTDWKKLCAGPYYQMTESQKIQSIYQKEIGRHTPLSNIKFNNLLGPLPILGGFGFWMPGVALIATYLSEKKGLTGLFVCANENALFTKIQEIAMDPKDQKCALILGISPLKQYEVLSYLCNLIGATDIFDKDFPQHKVMLGIEKKEGLLKVVLLDSTGDTLATHPYQQDLMTQILKTCKEANSTPDLFISEIPREFSPYGCVVFALQDSVSFLQNPDFFTKILFKDIQHKDLSIRKITELPPAHMIPTQSIARLDKYKEKVVKTSLTEVRNPSSFVKWMSNESEGVAMQSIPGRTKTLAEYGNRYFIPNSSSKKENHYVTKKMWGYMHFINAALKELTPEEVKKMIGTTLLTGESNSSTS